MKNGYPPGLMPDRLPAGLDEARIRTGTLPGRGDRAGGAAAPPDMKPDMKVETAGL